MKEVPRAGNNRYRQDLRPRPLQHVQVPLQSCASACALVPQTAVCSQPLQHLQMSAGSSGQGRPFIAGTSVFSRPLQHMQVSISSSI